MKSLLTALRDAFLAFSALGILVLACHLGQETTVENTLSFDKRFDSLKQYDSLVIEVKDRDGKSLGVIFKGKVGDPAQLDKLEVPGWDGGPIDIFITGFDKSQSGPVFEEKKSYNGITDKTDSTVILVYAHPTLAAATTVVQLAVGQRSALPQVEVHPTGLANPGLGWVSDLPGVAAVEGGELVGVSDGTALLTVTLGRDSTQKWVFTVKVGSGGILPTRLAFDRDTLYLAVHGAAGRFALQVEPALASPDVDWSLADSGIAALRSDGAFIGLARGSTKVTAASKLKPEIKVSGMIVVSDPVAVASVRFLKDSLDLFVGGAPESLLVEVLPAQANPEVAFGLSDSSKAILTGRLLAPKAAGSFTVTAHSLEDTSKQASLRVTVREAVHIDRVEAADSAVTLYLGGPGRELAARVLPGDAPQGVRWTSLSPAVVSVDAQTGAVAPLQAGFARVVATSAADNAQRDTVGVSVVLDAPRLAISADSVASAGASVVFHVTATQEFGQLTLFQWDLDGNGTWDDSLTGPWTGVRADLPPVTGNYDKAGPVTARFRVRDSEGNATLATQTVRIVGGSAVSIDAPPNNSYTNQKRINVAWSVNGVPQDSLKTQDLAVGPNVITRSARDSAGKSFTASITVTLDTVAPLKPVVSGSSPTNVKPKWSWSSGGGGGSGEYRFRLGDADFPADAPSGRDTAYTLAADPVSGTTYALYVEERDAAGNWSPAASLAVRYDVTSPVVAIAAPQASGIYYTSNASVTLTGTASGPLPITQVNYKVGAGASAKASFSAGAWSTSAITLAEGSSVPVTVTAVDQAGNSGEAVLNVFLDATPPGAPSLSAGPAEIGAVKGDFAWTAGTDAAPGSGLNGHYRYSLNGGAWKDTTGTSLTNLPLAEGTNVFAVQEQDRASGWSPSATRSVRVDTSGPVIAVTSHPNPANATSLTITLSGTVKDTGTAVAAMTVSGQQSGSGTVTVTAGIWTTAALTLKSGANSLLFTATDRIGNARTMTETVNVNVPAPVVAITNPADNLTITTSDTYIVTYTIDGGAAQTKSFNLVEGVNLLVVSSPANVSGNIGRDTVKVTRDATPPNAPTLTPGSSPTNGTASWTWVSNGDNAGGAGMRSPAQFRYSLDNGTTWVPTTATQYTVSAEGSYALIVQEQDKAGNWSPSSASKAIVVDKTPPIVHITWPADSLYVTNTKSAALTVHYNVENGPDQTASCALVTNGSKTCSVSSTDAAGNVGKDQVIVWSRPNVVFVTVNGSGAFDGSDWANAMDTSRFNSAMSSSAYNNHDFWLSTGTYTSQDVFAPTMSVNILAGFNAANHPVDTAGRAKTGTRFTSFFIDGGLGFSLNGGVVSRVAGYDVAVTLTDVQIKPITSMSNGLYFPDPGSNITANNLTIQNVTFDDCAIVAGGIMTLNGGTLTGLGGTEEPLQVSGTTNLNRPLVIGTSLSPTVHVGTSAAVNIQSGLAIDCRDQYVRVDDGGSCTVVP